MRLRNRKAATSVDNKLTTNVFDSEVAKKYIVPSTCWVRHRFLRGLSLYRELIFVGRIWVQASHCGYDHLSIGGEFGGQGGWSGSPLWIHRGLWTHGARNSHLAPAGQRGTPHPTAFKVHPLYLQQSDPGKRCRQSRYWWKCGDDKIYRQCVGEGMERENEGRHLRIHTGGGMLKYGKNIDSVIPFCSKKPNFNGVFLKMLFRHICSS